LEAIQNIIGREIDLGGKATVIGIMPPGFKYPIDETQDFWEPIFSASFMTKEIREERANRFLSIIGRLKPGVTVAQAKADLDLLSKQVEQHSPQSNTNVSSTRCRCTKTSRAIIDRHSS
jgi:putative ABC transport system permease protein